MKRSNIIIFVLSLIILEVACTVAGLNEIHHFFEMTLQKKYYVLMAVLYSSFFLFTLWYFVFVVPGSNASKGQLQQVFKICYGIKTYNLLFTWHFLLFSCAMFYLSYWVYFGLSLCLFIFWNGTRNMQNKFAETIELERIKEAAKYKPSVVLDSNPDNEL